MKSIASTLQGITGMIAQRSEVLVIFVVIGVIFMMILPMPTGLVDALIALNISVSALMVVIAMYMPGPLAFATFPALLLLTTLFRMGLSITTTRLILLQGDAGQIVEAFGEFVVGGNLVVGLVIFLILTIVNFLVITKGSERVAEVAARFTLDAMPGKQMSIDGDLRAGLLNAQQAQKKRADIGRESQLFGAMDGAMKFVKGDAIAGIIIVMVNILGGFSIGVMQLGLPAGEAIKVYAILTIGDGLVAQIPALLISICAGFIITRVSDSTADETNVGKEMASELAAEPKAWIIAAIVMMGFALVPGMPFFAFLCFALLFGGGGFFQMYMKFQMAKAMLVKATAEANAPEPAYDSGETDLRIFAPYDKLSINVKSMANPSKDFYEALRSVRKARNKIVTDKGYTIPSIEVREDPSLEDGQMSMLVYGVGKLSFNTAQDNIAVKLDHCNDKALAHLKTLGVDIEKYRAGDMKVAWLASDKKNDLESQSINFQTASQYIYQAAYETLLRESPQFIGIDETHKIVAWLTAESEPLAQELQRAITIPKFAEILQGLAKDMISMRSIRRIAEIVVESASVERSVGGLIDAVRHGLREQICNELATNNTLGIYLFEPEAEEKLRRYIRKTPAGDFLELPTDERQKLIESLMNTIDQRSLKQDIVVVAQDIRKVLRNMLRGDLFHLPVLSPGELTDSLSIVPKARLSL